MRKVLTLSLLAVFGCATNASDPSGDMPPENLTSAVQTLYEGAGTASQVAVDDDHAYWVVHPTDPNAASPNDRIFRTSLRTPGRVDEIANAAGIDAIAAGNGQLFYSVQGESIFRVDVNETSPGLSVSTSIFHWATEPPAPHAPHIELAVHGSDVYFTDGLPIGWLWSVPADGSAPARQLEQRREFFGTHPTLTQSWAIWEHQIANPDAETSLVAPTYAQSLSIMPIDGSADPTWADTIYAPTDRPFIWTAFDDEVFWVARDGIHWNMPAPAIYPAIDRLAVPVMGSRVATIAGSTDTLVWADIDGRIHLRRSATHGSPSEGTVVVDDTGRSIERMWTDGAWVLWLARALPQGAGTPSASRVALRYAPLP